MLALHTDLPGNAVLEVLLWAPPALLALRRARSAPPGERRTWAVVAAACVVIVLDKTVDLQAFAMAAGRHLVHAYAPDLAAHGGRPLARAALLGAFFVAGCAGMFALVRGDRRLERRKLLALAGLVGVMAYLGARLVPAVGQRLGPAGGAAIELACCALVWTGLVLPQRTAETAVTDVT